MLAALALVIVSMLPSLFLHIIGAAIAAYGAIGAFGLNGAGSRRVPPARQGAGFELTPLLLALAANALVFYALRRLIRTFERKA